MPELTDLRHLAQALAQRLYAGELGELVMDSRKVAAGGAFLALPGQHTHGNAHIAAALQRGARLAIADARVPHPAAPNVLAVPEPEAFLRFLAAAVRRLSPAVFIAVTGSTGKTTVKELIALALGGPPAVHRSPGNFNNHLGLPLTLANLRAGARFAVLEMGTSGPGEIARLVELARPHAGVITAIGESHLAGFGSLHAVALEKASLFAGLEASGLCFLPASVRRHEAVRRAIADREVLHYGLAGEEVAPEAVLWRGMGVAWSFMGQEFHLPSPGQHNLLNAQAAVAVAYTFGVPLARIARRLRLFKPADHRLRLIPWRRRSILDDCYNASPASVMAAADTALRLKGGGRVFAALGDMKELGSRSRALHRRVGEALARSGVDVLLARGDQAQFLLEGFERGGGRSSLTCHNAAEMAEFLRRHSRPRDIILLKGSRSMHMEEVLELLKAG